MGGIGEYFDIDPVLPRLGYFLLTFVTGLAPGIIAYIVAVIIIHEAPEIPSAAPVTENDDTQV